MDFYNTLKLLNDVKQESIKEIDDSFVSIMKLCNEDDDIKRIVEICLNEDHELNAYLTSFIWQCGSNIQRPNSSVLDELKSFLINYFYDDAEAYFEKDEFGFWIIGKNDDYACLSSPQDFLDYAKENYDMMINKIERHRRKNIEEINKKY